MLPKFEQCWHSICCNLLLLKNQPIHNKNCQKVTRCCLDITLDFFAMLCCLEPLGQHSIGFFLYNIVSRILRQYCTGFFLCNVVWSLKVNIAQGFNLCKVVPAVLRQHCRRFFLCNVVKIGLRQHCTRILLVQYQPRLYTRCFAGKQPIQCCLKSALDNIEQDSYLCIVGLQSTVYKYCLNTSEAMLYRRNY